MSPEKDKQLCDEFPELFRERQKNAFGSCMAWGLQCGDGWYNLIRALCLTIEGHCRIVTFRNLEKELPAMDVYFTGIKEKFGALRVSCYGMDDYLHGAVEFAELISETICEDCGASGKKGAIGCWIRTLCPDCIEKREM